MDNIGRDCFISFNVVEWPPRRPSVGKAFLRLGDIKCADARNPGYRPFFKRVETGYTPPLKIDRAPHPRPPRERKKHINNPPPGRGGDYFLYVCLRNKVWNDISFGLPNPCSAPLRRHSSSGSDGRRCSAGSFENENRRRQQMCHFRRF